MRTFDVTCSQTLSKSTSVETNNYTIDSAEEYDDDGNSFYRDYVDTTNTDWNAVYKDCKLTPLEIIQKCSHIVEYLIGQDKKQIDGISLHYLLDNCKDWIEDDFCVNED